MSYQSSILTDAEINSWFRIPTDWSIGVAYADSSIVNHNGATYVSLQAGTSIALTEPGIGTSWADFWEINATVIPTLPRIGQLRVRDSVTVAESAIREYIRQDFAVKVHRQLLPATHYPTPRGLVDYPVTDDIYLMSSFQSIHQVMLKHTPVHNDGSIVVYQDDTSEGGQATNSFPPESILTQGDDWFLDITNADLNISDTGIIYLNAGASDFPRNVRVEYRAGLADPSRIALMKEIVCHTINHNYKIKTGQNLTDAASGCCGSGNQPLSSESIGGYSYSVNTQLQSAYGTLADNRLIPGIVLRDLQTFAKYGYIEG